jgi:hypothetical protein
MRLARLISAPSAIASIVFGEGRSTHDALARFCLEALAVASAYPILR